MKREDAETQALAWVSAVEATRPGGIMQFYASANLEDARYDITLLSIASNEGMIGDDE